jgi:hypothetical protein
MRAFWAERRRRMKALRPVKGHLVLLANQMLYSILRIMKATRQTEDCAWTKNRGGRRLAKR